MANHDLMVEQHQDVLLRQDQYLGLSYNHSFILDHNLTLADIHEPKLDTGLSHQHDPGIGLVHDQRLVLSQSNEHDLAMLHTDVQNFEGNGLDDDDADQKHAEVTDHNNQLALTAQDHRLGLPENHELAPAENDGFDENLSLALVQNQQMDIVPASDITAQHELEVSPPVLQFRALVPNHELIVGQQFSDVQSCRRALRDAAIALRFEMQTIKSDKTRFTAKCASEGCPWRIHAAKLPGVPTFTIRTIHEKHTCGGISHLGHHQASVQWVAETVENRLRENPHCKPKEILEEIHRVHGIALSYKQAWRGKERFMANIRGSFEDDYRLLPQYCNQVRMTNPGSIASVYGNPVDNCFQRLFVSFQASIYGFLNGCRLLIGLDRTLLKSKYLGTLLLATGFDGDGAVFPLAFGVVDEENEENWMWFLSELYNLLETNTENMPKLTILSDRHKYIADAVDANFPTAFHGFCMRHLSESFYKEFHNSSLVNLLWEAAYSLTVVQFEQKVVEIEQTSQEAGFWVRSIPPHLWATAYFEGTRWGHLTCNIVESLNTWVIEASGLPVIQMMESIRRQLMTLLNERREMSMQWTNVLVPSAQKQISEAIGHSHSHQVLKANEAEFEVISHEGTFVVDIRTRHCLCRRWQLYGLPCSHAVAALLYCKQNVHRFTESCFTVATYRKTYSQSIHPIPDKALWKEASDVFQNEDNKGIELIMNPPKSLRPPGRPRKRRVRPEDNGRVKRVVHCSRCKQTGHFRTTCATPI